MSYIGESKIEYNIRLYHYPQRHNSDMAYQGQSNADLPPPPPKRQGLGSVPPPPKVQDPPPKYSSSKPSKKWFRLISGSASTARPCSNGLVTCRDSSGEIFYLFDGKFLLDKDHRVLTVKTVLGYDTILDWIPYSDDLDSRAWWTFENHPKGGFYIRNQRHNQVLDVLGRQGNRDDPSYVNLYDKNSRRNQAWFMLDE